MLSDHSIFHYKLWLHCHLIENYSDSKVDWVSWRQIIGMQIYTSLFIHVAFTKKKTDIKCYQKVQILCTYYACRVHSILLQLLYTRHDFHVMPNCANFALTHYNKICTLTHEIILQPLIHSSNIEQDRSVQKRQSLISKVFFLNAIGGLARRQASNKWHLWHLWL